jgi:hypothetical protein
MTAIVSRDQRHPDGGEYRPVLGCDCQDCKAYTARWEYRQEREHERRAAERSNAAPARPVSYARRPS